MASDLMWGGLIYMQPSTLATNYMHHTKVIPERMIRTGARYRARKNLVEHVRGYKETKKDLQQLLANIDHERKCAHYHLPERQEALNYNLRMAQHTDDFPRPTNFFFRTTYGPKCPLFKPKVDIGNTEPRLERILGIRDISKQIAKTPSEKIKADPNYTRPTAQEILGIKDQSHEELRKQMLGLRKSL